MTKKTGKPEPHPDDFILVTVNLEFRAKPNPEVNDPQPFDTTEIQYTMSAAEAADYLERLASKTAPKVRFALASGSKKRPKKQLQKQGPKKKSRNRQT